MRLTYKNDWETDVYYVDKKRITDLKLVRINDQEFKVSSRTVCIPYRDMGHTYNGVATHYFIKIDVLGKKTEFDLNTLVKKHKISALKYTLYEQ